MKDTKIKFDEIIDVYDHHGPYDREVEVLGYDCDGNEYTATGIESCGSIVEIYTETIEETGTNRGSDEEDYLLPGFDTFLKKNLIY